MQSVVELRFTSAAACGTMEAVRQGAAFAASCSAVNACRGVAERGDTMEAAAALPLGHMPQTDVRFFASFMVLLRHAVHVPKKRAERIVREWDKATKTGYRKKDVADISKMSLDVAHIVPLAASSIGIFKAMAETPGCDPMTWDVKEGAAVAQHVHIRKNGMLELRNCMQQPCRRPVVECAADTSAIGYGGYSDDLPGQSKMVESFSTEEQELVAADNYPSGEQELLAVVYIARIIMNVCPTEVMGELVVVKNDCKEAVLKFNLKKGKGKTLELLRAVHRRAEDLGITPRAQWKRRDSPEIVRADQLSREEDHDNFAVSQRLFDDICGHPVPHDPNRGI